MEIYLLRHGETQGNMEKRYIGITDEGLCPLGRRQVNRLKAALKLPRPLTVAVSPLRRCRETAEILFPGQEIQVAEGLRECDFGRFEGHNYQELNGDPEYQAWIDSGGERPFPGGESKAAFSQRCCQTFSQLPKIETMALVVHGGTIMALMEAFALPQKTYYDWMVKPAEGYRCEWKPEIQKMELIEHVPVI